MANRITNDCVDVSESFKMSNSLTSVVISLLALSGSALAESEHEKLLIVWFASRDQAISGRGTVGFDLNEIPWTVEQFEAEKHFLLSVIRRAQSMQDWGRLSYEPREDWALTCLEELAHMISHFPATCINPQIALDQQAWWRPAEFVLCPKHGVLQHTMGCIVCNDGDPIGSV
jgi:hypothetical protein